MKIPSTSVSKEGLPILPFCWNFKNFFQFEPTFRTIIINNPHRRHKSQMWANCFQFVTGLELTNMFLQFNLLFILFNICIYFRYHGICPKIINDFADCTVRLYSSSKFRIFRPIDL